MSKTKRRQAKWILVALMAIGLSAAIVGSISTALFTDTAQIQSSTFATGTIDIDLSDSNETDADNLTTSDITFSAMAPGDQVQPTGGITVRNNGTLDLRYALYVAATDPDTNNLKDELEITIKGIDVTVPATPCDDFDGASIYPATTNFDGAAAAGTFVSLFGSETAGADAGDRPLTAAASEVLCFRVKLPTTAPNSVQNSTTTLTFEFRAEQTANNP